MKFVCIVFELGDKMLTLPSMENLKVQCNLKSHYKAEMRENMTYSDRLNEFFFEFLINTMYAKRHSSRIF